MTAQKGSRGWRETLQSAPIQSALLMVILAVSLFAMVQGGGCPTGRRPLD